MGDRRAGEPVDRYLVALGAQDWPALARCLAADVERIGPYGDVFVERDAYVAFLQRTVSALPGYELRVDRLVTTADVVTAELSETIDTADGRRRTHEAVVFDVAGDVIHRIAVYLRKSAIVTPGPSG